MYIKKSFRRYFLDKKTDFVFNFNTARLTCDLTAYFSGRKRAETSSFRMSFCNPGIYKQDES
jgi:hypothetical protein